LLHPKQNPSSLWRSRFAVLTTARHSGAGICNRGGHSGGVGIEQVPAWSKSEYSNPQTFSHRHLPLYQYKHSHKYLKPYPIDY
jgi:hypothetical protein